MKYPPKTSFSLSAQTARARPLTAPPTGGAVCRRMSAASALRESPDGEGAVSPHAETAAPPPPSPNAPLSAPNAPQNAPAARLDAFGADFDRRMAARALLPPPSARERTATVVFDLDETLCNNRGAGPALLRPGAAEMLRALRLRHPRPPPDGALRLELVVWTASVEAVARPVIARLNADGAALDDVICRDVRWYRDGAYTKDLRRLGRRLDRVVVVENAPSCVAMNRRNAILVTDFVNSRSDRQLTVVWAILQEWLERVQTLVTQRHAAETEEKRQRAVRDGGESPQPEPTSDAKENGNGNGPSRSTGHVSAPAAAHPARKKSTKKGTNRKKHTTKIDHSRKCSHTNTNTNTNTTNQKAKESGSGSKTNDKAAVGANTVLNTPRTARSSKTSANAPSSTSTSTALHELEQKASAILFLSHHPFLSPGTRYVKSSLWKSAHRYIHGLPGAKTTPQRGETVGKAAPSVSRAATRGARSAKSIAASDKPRGHRVFAEMARGPRSTP